MTTRDCGSLSKRLATHLAARSGNSKPVDTVGARTEHVYFVKAYWSNGHPREV